MNSSASRGQNVEWDRGCPGVTLWASAVRQFTQDCPSGKAGPCMAGGGGLAALHINVDDTPSVGVLWRGTLRGVGSSCGSLA